MKCSLLRLEIWLSLEKLLILEFELDKNLLDIGRSCIYVEDSDFIKRTFAVEISNSLMSTLLGVRAGEWL